MTRPDTGRWPPRRAARAPPGGTRETPWYSRRTRSPRVRGYGLPGPAPRWEALRGHIHHAVVTHAFDAERNTFTHAYGSAALDASLLLIPRDGFLPATDPRVLGTIAAVRRELSDGGLVRRYSTAATDDGAKGSEGLFIACSFWLVDALHASGQKQDAADLFERLLALRNDVGVQPLRPGRQRPPTAHGERDPQRLPDDTMTTRPVAVIDRVTLVVSDLDRTEEDYINMRSPCLGYAG